MERVIRGSLHSGLVQVQGQGSSGIHDLAEEILGHIVGHAGGIQQRRRFPDDTAHGQNHGGEDSRNGAGQHDAQNHPQLARAQGHGSLLVGAGHREEAFLGGADDGRQDTEGHGQAAGQNGGSHAEHYAEHRVTEQAEQNRGDAGQNLRGKPDGPHQPPLLSVLSQINGG